MYRAEEKEKTLTTIGRYRVWVKRDGESCLPTTRIFPSPMSAEYYGRCLAESYQVREHDDIPADAAVTARQAIRQRTQT